jgi:hypothetical protein
MMICVFGPPLGGVVVAFAFFGISLVGDPQSAIGSIPQVAPILLGFGLLSYFYAFPGAIAAGVYVGLRIGFGGRISGAETLLVVSAVTMINVTALASFINQGGGVRLTSVALLWEWWPTLASGILLRWLMLRLGVLERREQERQG